MFCDMPGIIVLIILQFCAGILTVECVGTTNIQLTGNCDQLLENFAERTATFTYCAISNARPITFCTKCVNVYIEVLRAYQEIFEDVDETGEPCKEKLLNLDRLEIITVIFKSTFELWSRGSCNYCFETESNGTLTKEPRNETKEFMRRDEVLKQCIDEHQNDTEPNTVCITCRNTYLQLNNYYNIIKQKAAEKDNDNVCMDIVDLMNATRTEWSKQLHCIPIRHTQVPLYVSGGILLATPVVFYAFSMWFSGRDRRNEHDSNSASRSMVNEPSSSSNLLGPSIGTEREQ